MSRRSTSVLLSCLAVVAVLALVSSTLYAVHLLRALDRTLEAAAKPGPSTDRSAADPSAADPSSGPSPTSPSESQDGATAPTSPPTYTAARIDELLSGVEVLATRPHVPGYDRDCGPGDGCVFGTEWTDDTEAPDGHNGCDTRNDVLREQLFDVAFKPGSNDCDVVAGHFVDPYTGTPMDYATQGSQIHVDHLFPLAAAWDLGASTWSLDQRARFANDTSIELLAVNGGANASKGDSTPASWLPPVKPYRCEYIVRFLTAAESYGLAITEADVRVIAAVQRKSCPA